MLYPFFKFLDGYSIRIDRIISFGAESQVVDNKKEFIISYESGKEGLEHSFEVEADRIDRYIDTVNNELNELCLNFEKEEECP